MIRKISVLVVLAASLLAVNSYAATESQNVPLKIGVINAPEILQASPEMKAAGEKLRSQFEPRQQKILALQKKIEADQAKLKRDATVMTADERTKLQDKIASDQRDIRRQEEDFMQDARAAEKKVMESMVEKINKVLQQIAEREHYDLILQRNVVAFASDRTDLTKKVIADLKNQKG